MTKSYDVCPLLLTFLTLMFEIGFLRETHQLSGSALLNCSGAFFKCNCLSKVALMCQNLELHCCGSKMCLVKSILHLDEVTARGDMVYT